MSLFGGKLWWKDKEKGWPGKGVGSFFDESKRHYLAGDIDTAIEVLQWGREFSLEFGSGGAVARFDGMIEKLENE